MEKKSPIKFSIITPTKCRTSLVDTVNSIKKQTYIHWQHIIVVDGEKIGHAIDLNKLYLHRMKGCVYKSPVTNNFGNSQRRIGWKYCTGDYIIYIDDDDTYFDNRSLSELATAIKNAHYPTWGVFNAVRYGSEFLNEPGMCQTMSCQLFHKRYDDEGNPIKWIEVEPFDKDYHWDGRFIEWLKATYGDYKVLQTKPLVNVIKQSNGQ